MKVPIRYAPHSAKTVEIHQSKARFRVVNCGRRFGKTYLASGESAQMCFDVHEKFNRPSRGWIVAPTYDLTMEFWRAFVEVCRNLIKPNGIKRGDKRIELLSGDEIEFKSTHNKDENLRGAGLDWLIMDEAARCHRDAWEAGLRPALADRRGRALFLSTPKGSTNWFREIHQCTGPDWQSWTCPSNESPLFPPEEFELLRRTMPNNIFRQEFLAEFLEDEGVVFRGIRGCIGGDLQDCVEGHKYIVGVDLARVQDFTVIVVLDVTSKRIVHFERFQNLDWPFQKQRIKWVAKNYNDAVVWVDGTGIGDPIEQDLRKDGLEVWGYKFTNESKKELVELAMVCIEQHLFIMPEIPELIKELQDFEYELLPGGSIRYRAPEGEMYHDDCVFALCLALWGGRQWIYLKNKIVEKKPYADLPPNQWAFWQRHEEEMKRLDRPKDVMEELTI